VAAGLILIFLRELLKQIILFLKLELFDLNMLNKLEWFNNIIIK
jgi:hypothetical protein